MSDNKVMIVEFTQDADSFGWAMLALFHARYTIEKRRWGVLNALVGTHQGADIDARTREEAIALQWNLIDWYATEAEARAAFTEAKSRVW